MKVKFSKHLVPDDENVEVAINVDETYTVTRNGEVIGHIDYAMTDHPLPGWRAVTHGGALSRHWSWTAAFEQLLSTRT